MKKAKLKLTIESLKEKLVKAEEVIRIQNKNMQKGIDTIKNELLLVNQDVREMVARQAAEIEKLKQEDMEREMLMRRMIRCQARNALGNASGKELQMWGNTVGARPVEEFQSESGKESFET